MKKGIWSIVISCIVALTGCSSDSCDIHTLCVRDEVGNYIIKWEMNPQVEGIARIYVSDTPNKFDMSRPVILVNIKEGVTRYVTQDNMRRKYFRITFNDQCPQDVAARYSFMDNIQNFRDLGGYVNKEGKLMKWGMIYRSGLIGRLSDRDSLRIRSTKIKTIIDLRTNEEVKESPIYFPDIKIIHIPIVNGDKKKMLDYVFRNRVRKRDGSLYMEDKYIQFVSQSTDEFAQALQVLTDKRNYPILIHGELGKDRTGFLSAILLTLLDVPHETVMKDYLESNRYIDPSFMSKTVCSLSSDAQETMTVLLSVQESFLDIAYKEIDKQFGSFKDYTEKGLYLSARNREKLKDILLK